MPLFMILGYFSMGLGLLTKKITPRCKYSSNKMLQDKLNQTQQLIDYFLCSTTHLGWIYFIRGCPPAHGED